MSIAIGYASNDVLEQAKQLAHQYHFSLNNEVLPRLCVTIDKLVLCIDKFTPLFADFDHLNHVRRQNAGKKQGLISACKPTKGLRIIDVTAGWGRDAALLVHFGADVLMIERQPVMAALLEDALKRKQATPHEGTLSLLHLDAKTFLKALLPQDYPDVIYIDPMHPLRQKSALVKKDMQALQQLFGPDEDAKELIEIAMSRVRKKVVVKWPERSPPLLPPSNSIHGKTVRFDMYIR